MPDEQPEETESTDRLQAARQAKLDRLREAGIEVYPVRFERTATAAGIAATYADLEAGAETGDQVTVAGRLVGARHLGRLSFGVLRDQSGSIQLFLDQRHGGDAHRFFEDSLDVGDWVGATGEVIVTKRGELSVRVHELSLLAKSLRPLPEKWHGLKDVEARHRQRYVDLIVNEDARKAFRVRSETVKSLRRGFEDRGFIEVETPVLQTVYGGALARPFTTHHNTLDMDMFLRIALELPLKRLVVGGMEKVFEIGRVFRNEGISPRRNPEFSMLEAYWALADYGDIMELVEEVVAEACVAVHGTTEIEYDGRPVSFAPPFARISYVGAVADATGEPWDIGMPLAEAQRMAAEHGLEVDGVWGVGKIISTMFDAVVEPGLWNPTFAVDYPIEISPLARKHRDDPRLVERFELMICGREMANAFSELNDPHDQRERFEAQQAARAEGDDEAHPIDEDYLRALEYGLPPSGGLGIGIDRLVMILADQQSIREVILFPTMRPE